MKSKLFRRIRITGRVACALLAMLALLWLQHPAVQAGRVRQAEGSQGLHLNPPFQEPVALRSKDKVLEVALTAVQSTANLNTVSKPVEGMLLYSWTLLQGTSDGPASGEHQYPGPTLMVNPGDRLIVHAGNGLKDLTIPDLVDPTLTPSNETVPLTPRISRSMPLNLHTHGLHVSPGLNSDNVMIEFEPGQLNTYVYDIPDDHPEGLLWYHPHRHQYTEQQVYRGLAGMLVVGRAEGRIPKVIEHDLPVRLMALQSNFVANRAAGMHLLTYPAWTQMISTWDQPADPDLQSGAYQPVAAPINFPDSPAGTRFKTNWFAGPLTSENKRGAFQFMPQNLIGFTGRDRGGNSPAETATPDHQRDYQYTVNGQFQPRLSMAPGQTEVWVIGNFGSQSYMNIAVRNTATHRLVPLRILATDGNASPAVLEGSDPDGTTYLLSSSSRVAIAVTMPSKGGLQLELPPVAGEDANHTQPLSTEGIVYTSRGDGSPPTAAQGTVAIQPRHVNWFDGFKSTPTQVLARVVPEGSPVASVAFQPGESLRAPSAYLNLSAGKADLTRSFTIAGGANPHINPRDPNGFMYMFNRTSWPTTPVIHPRLNSVEEWKIYNSNNDQHPLHVHVNDFEISRIVDPVTGRTSGPLGYAVDNFNVPAPTLQRTQEVDNSGEKVRQQGEVWLRSTFKDFLGTFVMHCHRLDHEDNGLMMTVNVIPEVSTAASAEWDQARQSVRVVVRDQADGRVLGTVHPFAHAHALPSLAMADVDGDAVLDLIAGQGPGAAPEVVVYRGGGTDPFSAELMRFNAFEADFKGGVSLAAGTISGSPVRNNLIVGSGPGRPTAIRVFSSALPGQLGVAPDRVAEFAPFPGEQGVVVAAGLVSPGRISVVAASAASDQIKVFQFPLLRNLESPMDRGAEPGVALPEPDLITAFDAFPDADGPVSLATGWIAADEGGLASLVVGQRSGQGNVRVFSWASNLHGQSPMYVQSSHQQHAVHFKPTLTMAPFQGPVVVSTTSTTSGADLVIAGQEKQRFVARIYTPQRSSRVADGLVAKPRRTLARSQAELSVAGA